MSQHVSAGHDPPSPPALPFYELLIAIQQRRGWTKVQLAQKAGVNRGTIDNWAKQPKAPLASTIVPVADRLGIDPDEALRLAGIRTESKPLTAQERAASAEVDRTHQDALASIQALLETKSDDPEALEQAERLIRAAWHKETG